MGIPWIDDVSNATEWLDDSVYQTNTGDLVHGLFSTQNSNSRTFTFGNHSRLRLVKFEKNTDAIDASMCLIDSVS